MISVKYRPTTLEHCKSAFLNPSLVMVFSFLLNIQNKQPISQPLAYNVFKSTSYVNVLLISSLWVLYNLSLLSSVSSFIFSGFATIHASHLTVFKLKAICDNYLSMIRRFGYTYSEQPCLSVREYQDMNHICMRWNEHLSSCGSQYDMWRPASTLPQASHQWVTNMFVISTKPTGTKSMKKAEQTGSKWHINVTAWNTLWETLYNYEQSISKLTEWKVHALI